MGKERLWFIKNKTTEENWSNQFGWVEELCDLYTDLEKDTVNLPIDGEWELFEEGQISK